MAWDKLSITGPHLVYIILGGFTSLFMLCSSIFKERMYIGEATVATICGVIFGPHAANLINPASWGGVDIITIEFSRIVLVVQCFAVGVELPKYYMEKHWRSVFFLLVPVMTWGWLITSLLIWWLIKPLNFLESLVVAACVTATDPVLASSVVGKGKFAKRVPKHLRDLLSAESGCNDGMAFPFIYLALYLIHDKQSAKEVSFHWIVYTILYECLFGCVYGFIVGYLARHGIKFAEKHDMIDRESFLVFYFTLALFCAGSGSILGVDDLLVGFAAGVGFSNDGWFTQKTEESHVSNVIDLLLNLAYFVYLGTIIPWGSFNDSTIGLQAWRLSVLAILVILFRRIPIMMALKPLIPDIKTWREALFAGHFGPIGVGAIFVAMLARAELESEDPVPLDQLPAPTAEHYTLITLVWPIVSFMVVSSIIVHGSSVAVFTLGKHINTLTVTMSYTAANDDGPHWMSRLPRISSQSRSQARSVSELEGEELKMPEYPPGTLPPIGYPGNFLRRVRDEDHSGRNSRSSSRASRWRRKRWDDGIGPGGPISQSAIFPQRRTQGDQATPSQRASSDMPQQEQETPSMPTAEAGSSAAETPAQASTSGTTRVSMDAQGREERLEVYEEGNTVVVENRDGDVVSITSITQENAGPDAKTLEMKLKSEAGASGWTYEALKRRIMNWREAEMEKRKGKEKMFRKSEPARAFQFGNTIILENEDGDVIKKYDLPSDKSQSDLVAQGLKYMGMGIFVKVLDKAGGAAEKPGQGEGALVAQRGKKKSLPNEQDEEDDKHIRFTIGGIGKRLTKEDFLNEMKKLDKNQAKALAQQMTQSKANASPSRSAAGKTGSSSAPAATTMPCIQVTPDVDTTKAEGETDAERKRRLAALKGMQNLSEEAHEIETEAERRRREAALGLRPHGAEEDSEDDDTPRLPPSRRSIRFAAAPNKERKDSA